jgi:hypothetical protein
VLAEDQKKCHGTNAIQCRIVILIAHKPTLPRAACHRTAPATDGDVQIVGDAYRYLYLPATARCEVPSLTCRDPGAIARPPITHRERRTQVAGSAAVLAFEAKDRRVIAARNSPRFQGRRIAAPVETQDSLLAHGGQIGSHEEAPDDGTMQMTGRCDVLTCQRDVQVGLPFDDLTRSG